MNNDISTRARIVISARDRVPVNDIARVLGISKGNVNKWIRRFKEERLDGLKDRSRPGRPPKLGAQKIEEILRKTVEERPSGGTHWSVRLMAKAIGVTKYQVRRIWKATGLKPHRIKTFKISQDPLFAEKVVDIVGLYRNPPKDALVLSVDEKTQIQALDRTQPMLQLRPGQIERRTHDYKRHGTLSLYAAFDIATGQVIGRVTVRHRAKEFLEFLELLDRKTQGITAVHIILDNSSTHKTAEVNEWLRNHPRFHFHFTPTSSSWMNAVESWFSSFGRRALYRGVFKSVKELKSAIESFIDVHNKEYARPFKWTKSAESILASFNRAKAAQLA